MSAARSTSATPASAKTASRRSTSIDSARRVTLVADAAKAPILKAPNGLLMDSHMHLLILDFATGELHRMNVDDATTEKVADGFDGGDGLAWDHFGRLYVSSWKQGDVWVIGRPGEKPVLIAEGFQSAADMCLDPTGRQILVPDMKAGTLTALPIGVPGRRARRASACRSKPRWRFPTWSGPAGAGEVRRPPVPLRPIVLTHAGDGSNRVFVATQHGVIHVFPNDQKATQDQGLSRYPGPRPLRATTRTKKASWAWPSIRTSRRTASSSSSTRSSG